MAEAFNLTLTFEQMKSVGIQGISVQDADGTWAQKNTIMIPFPILCQMISDYIESQKIRGI